MLYKMNQYPNIHYQNIYIHVYNIQNSTKLDHLLTAPKPLQKMSRITNYKAN